MELLERISLLDDGLKQAAQFIQAAFIEDKKHASLFDITMADNEIKWKTDAVIMFLSGLNKKTIAGRVGKSRQTVTNYLNQPKIKIRIESARESGHA
jgi:hypothetical protein